MLPLFPAHDTDIEWSHADHCPLVVFAPCTAYVSGRLRLNLSTPFRKGSRKWSECKATKPIPRSCDSHTLWVIWVSRPLVLWCSLANERMWKNMKDISCCVMAHPANRRMIGQAWSRLTVTWSRCIWEPFCCRKRWKNKTLRGSARSLSICGETLWGIMLGGK